jgi:hypothetical protein
MKPDERTFRTTLVVADYNDSRFLDPHEVSDLETLSDRTVGPWQAAAAHPRRSKADVQQEFHKIREEVAATREGRNAKVEEAATLRAARFDGRSRISRWKVPRRGSPSGARALAHVNQIAMEQAKARAGQV